MAPTTDYDTPGGKPASVQTVEEQGIAIDSTGTADIGTIVADEATVVEVRVISTAQDFDFNIELNGSDTFTAEQSPSDAQESFTPDQNTRVGGTDDAEIVADVSSASGTGGATATVLAVVEYRRD